MITNKKLFQFQLKDHGKWDNCDELETIQYLLVECNAIKKLLQDVHKWMKQKVRRQLISDTASIILSNAENKYLAKYIIIVLKHESYKGKWQNYIPTLCGIKRILKSYMKIEIFIATVNDTVEKTKVKWSSFTMTY